MMELNKDIFREYDIRGVYPTDIDKNTAYLIGRAFASNLKRMGKDKTLVGYDNRYSSPELEQYLIKGITESGVDVVRLGLVTTPMYYYAWDLLNIKCGVMITASHNPKDDNGFKFSYNGIHNAYGDDVKNIYNTIIKQDFTNGNGIIEKADIKEAYLKMIPSSINMGEKKLKVVYDCGNGTTAIIAHDIFKDTENIKYIPLFADSDPTFPNHHPDPAVEENLRQLKEEVIKNKADLGIAFDGDGDRVGVVDELGNMIDIDKYMIIIWRDICDKVEPKTALFDIKCSKVLEDELIKLNIKPNCYRTGNSYMKAESVRGNYPFSGELSGHIFFRDKFNGYDDGIYAGLRLIEILSKTNKSVTDLLKGINTYYATRELKRKVTDDTKFQIVDKVKDYCIKNNYKILTIDGVKVLFEDGSAIVRASNTGPNLTMRYEATSENRLNEIKQEFDNLLDTIINNYK